MDFGTKLAFDGQATPLPGGALPMAWFERSSGADHRFERGLLGDSNSLLDRLRETVWLVYSGEGEDDL